MQLVHQHQHTPVSRVTDGKEPASDEISAATQTSAEILDIVLEYALNKFNDSMERIAAGRPKFLWVIDRFVKVGAQVEMCLPAFPFKSANKVDKVFGILPDKAEELALERLDTMYLLGISDRDTWAYGQALRAMAVQKGFNHIDFSRLRDLVSFPLPEKLEEITYVANATNFRRFLFNQYGQDDLDIDHEIATSPDTQMTYLGYRRFLESDLRYIFPLGKGRSNHSYKKDIKYLAKQMLTRGYAFAGAVKSAYPHHLRLSIHRSTGEHKVSMGLLNTKTGFTTPWHCSVALMADGEWTSATMADFQKDPKMEIVCEDGRPSYFQEKTYKTQVPLEGDEQKSGQEASDCPIPFSAGPVPSVKSAVERPPTVKMVEEKVKDQSLSPAIARLEERDQEKITEFARALSYLGAKAEKQQLNDLLFDSEHPLLDPNSSSFSSKAWLERLASITSGLALRDPISYSRRIAGGA
ncbi:MAG: hypothetical protein Q9207_003463 [Kuettlingeria erythrocarpa]